MTTIAWDGKMLAADTQSTSGHIRDASCPKIMKRGRALAAAAGHAAHCKAFMDWFARGCVGAPKMGDGDISANGVIFCDGRIIRITEAGMYPLYSSYYSEGSGWEIALGAMAAGATAKEAVEIAARYDVNTGGEIQVLTPGQA